MSQSFSEIMLFQVKPDQLEAFEALVRVIQAEQKKLAGCLTVRYMKRFYTFDDVESGQPPRELTKIVKCVKYFCYLEFDSIEHCGEATAWFFEKYARTIMRLLLMPFDIHSGYSI